MRIKLLFFLGSPGEAGHFHGLLNVLFFRDASKLRVGTFFSSSCLLLSSIGDLL